MSRVVFTQDLPEDLTVTDEFHNKCAIHDLARVLHSEAEWKRMPLRCHVARFIHLHPDVDPMHAAMMLCAISRIS